jgi:hypothetical protein
VKKLRIALIVVLALTAVFVVGGLLLPARVQVSRARNLPASREPVYALVASLKNGWPKFSAFSDPQMQSVFSGPESGAGATQKFSGGKSPRGSMTLTAADPASGVAFDIDLEGGVVVRGKIGLEAKASGTRVTWADEIELGNALGGRWMGLLLPKMLGASIDESLERLGAATRVAQK